MPSQSSVGALLCPARGSWLAVGLATLLAGCGSNTPEIPPELLDSGSSSSNDYPAGPYGSQVGDTVENFSFQGWRDPIAAGFDTSTIETVAFGDFHDPDDSPSIHLVLLNTAAVWCQPCREEHAVLPQRFEELGPRGLAIVSALFQDADAEPATLDDLRSWAATFDTNFALVLDPDYQMGRYGPAATPPVNVLVDARDMTIIERFIGNQEGPLLEAIESELDARQ